MLDLYLDNLFCGGKGQLNFLKATKQPTCGGGGGKVVLVKKGGVKFLPLLDGYKKQEQTVWLSR